MAARTIIPIQPQARDVELSVLNSAERQRLQVLLDKVKDPELPMLSIGDLGILRDFGRASNGDLVIVITPTYSGCPAVTAIREAIASELREAGYEQFHIEERLAPAWTTDWMSEAGKRALEQHGIAAPLPANCGNPVPATGLTCPNCQSDSTALLSEFGSTACKAMYRCGDCLETFDYFKGF